MAETVQLRNKNTGEVVTLRRKEKEPTNILPEAAEAAGSLAGAAVGGVPGSAVGAGVGRAVGEVGEQAGVGFSPMSGLVMAKPIDRQVAGINNVIGGIAGGVGEFSSQDRDVAKDIITNAAVAAGGDLAFGVAGSVIGKAANFLNTGVARGLFGKEVADRFMARPQQVFGKVGEGIDATAKKVGSFFSDLTQQYGKNVEDVVKGSNKLSTLDDQIENISRITEGGAAIEFLDVPKGQKDRLRNIVQEIAAFGGRNVDANTVWDLRKGVDSVIDKTSRTSEARQVLYGIRNQLSDKLKTFDKNISKVFNDYQFVKNAQDELGRYFKTIDVPTGETRSPSLERFTKNLLKSDKTEVTNILKDIDAMAPAEKKVAEQILDVAAAEGITKDIGGGVFSRVVLQQLGGSQNIAKFLAFPKSLQAQAIERAIRATGGTGTTALLTRE